MNTQLHPRPARTQRGVVLIMALIMLAIIAITSAQALKSITLGDQIGNNLRGQKLAQQVAEAGLRWCEMQVLQNNPALPVLPEPDDPTVEAWQVLANWNNAVAVPAAVIANALGNQALPQLPQCLAQLAPLSNLGVADNNLAQAQVMARSVRVSIRGFSPDYVRVNNTGAGSEVWIVSRQIN